MSDSIKHECGIAVVRLKRDLAYYHANSHVLHGLRLLEALMMKQRNRGQDGIGIGCVKLEPEVGSPYMFRVRSMVSADHLGEVFEGEMKEFKRIARRVDAEREEEHKRWGTPCVPFKQDPAAIKREFEMAGEIYMGHLRYGTSGAFGKGSLHPYMRRSTWRTRSLMVMGNFNLTNTSELDSMMRKRGQHPVTGTDTQSVLEEIGFQLDEAHTQLYHQLRDAGTPPEEIAAQINPSLDTLDVIKRSAQYWDGGYTIVGAVGNGDLFVMRDPNGIRPCYYYENDELIAFASERVALMSVLEVAQEEVKELPRAHVMVVKADGSQQLAQFTQPSLPKPCSFERIYFSRGNDADIYQQRKRLGEQLVPQVVKAIDNDFHHSVISFIPNTAEVAYFGFLDGLRKSRRIVVKDALMQMIKSGHLDEEKLDDLVLRNWPRAEKIAHKDIKQRTFIAQENGRDKMVSSVYDVTYGSVTDKDTLIVIDDSIVRGTTLKTSLLRILARTNPQRIIVVSTAPQIRYPDCYGIDMAELGKFIAFQAAIRLLQRDGRAKVINETAIACKDELARTDKSQMQNAVKAIYAGYTNEDISAQVAELVKPENTAWKGQVQVIFQTVPDLHQALGDEFGDWYFTGNYPTSGGYAVVNRSFLQYLDGKGGRAYGEGLL
jgi:amidophosphoribosyltransferase